jgi:2-hydroxy-6-oxonona-2,4-dienedioate hydrolase
MTILLTTEALAGRLLGKPQQATFLIESGPPDGQPVLFVHGFGGTSRNFSLNVAALAKAGYRVVAPELWGMGRSAQPRGRYSLDRWVEQLIEVMDTLDIRRTLLVGHSMGGAVAVRLARRYPERVEKLVLVAPLGFGGRRKVGILRVATLPGLVPTLAKLRFRSARQSQTPTTVTPTVLGRIRFFLGRLQAPPPTVEEMLERARWRFGGRISEEGALAWAESAYLAFQQQNAVEGLRRAGRACIDLIGGSDQRVRRDYAELTLPTLAIWGAEDRTVPAQDSATLRSLRADARLEMYPQCSHHPYLEATDRFNSMLLEFFGES